MIYGLNKKDISTVANILKNGGIIGIPTETVYGLAANALDINAVAAIFKAKGRPADNPLIVHISDINDLEKYAYPPQIAYTLAKAFWPGPLTMIMKKKSIIPDIVSAGLDTVAIRFPSHLIAQLLIKKSGIPIAAPSANISGSPSPTTAQHVIHDFADKIDGVIDGGKCECGVESTVISIASDIPVLLRPGFVTPDQLREYLPNLIIAEAVLHELPQNVPVLSPGLKHKHYAPKALTTCVSGSSENAKKYINRNAFGFKNICVICFDEEKDCYPGLNVFTYGSIDDSLQLASNLFSVLRQADDVNADRLFIRTRLSNGVGLAVYNRLLRACAFNIIDSDNESFPKILGVTGPTGSGKSTFSKLGESLGYVSINADEVYNTVLPELIQKLIDEFGDSILNNDGSLNRKELASKAFASSESTEKLSFLTHPVVMEWIKRKMSELANKGTKAIIIDAIALIEAGGVRICDKTITIYSEYETRQMRIMERDNISYDEAQLRINAQKSIDFYIKNTDYAIANVEKQTFETEVVKFLKNFLEE